MASSLLTVVVLNDAAVVRTLCAIIGIAFSPNSCEQSSFFQEEQTIPAGANFGSRASSASLTYPSTPRLAEVSARASHLNTPGLSINDLCRFIAEFRSLRTALVHSCSCFIGRVGSSAPHRFLILKLRRSGKGDIWLRIDRGGGFKKGASSASSRLGNGLGYDLVGRLCSNDPACTLLNVFKQTVFAGEFDRLNLPPSTQENEQIFAPPRTLEDFRTLLDIILEESAPLQMHSVNCVLRSL